MKTLDDMTSSASHILTRRLCSAVLVNSGSLGLVSHEPGQRPGLSRYVVTRGNHFHENTRPSYCLICLSVKICLGWISSVKKKKKKSRSIRFQINFDLLLPTKMLVHIMLYINQSDCKFSTCCQRFLFFLSFSRMASPDKRTLRGSRLPCVRTI